MTAGLVRGLDHEDSARFAFLLATPVVSVAFLVRSFRTRTLAPFGAYCLLFGLAMVVYLSVR